MGLAGWQQNGVLMSVAVNWEWEAGEAANTAIIAQDTALTVGELLHDRDHYGEDWAMCGDTLTRLGRK